MISNSLLKSLKASTPRSAGTFGTPAAGSPKENTFRVYVRACPSKEEPAWELLPTSLTSTADRTRFFLDGCYGEKWATDRIYSRVLLQPMEKLLDGFSLTLFAYGQTGSGKTHTILGNSTEAGFVQLAVEQLFGMLQADELQWTVTFSALEIYMSNGSNEQLRDLLAPKGLAQLTVRESKSGEVAVENLKQVVVRSSQQVMELLQEATGARETRRTHMNTRSSRSHALFMMRVEVKRPGEQHTSVSHLTLGDLAGSERACKAGTTGVGLKEGGNINKSLHHLSEVILNLKRKFSKKVIGGVHVPYRHSKLTHVLKGSLSGNCTTIVFCTVNLGRAQHGETASTLKFATHAKSVKVMPTSVRRVDVQQQLRRQQEEIETLRKQLNYSDSFYIEHVPLQQQQQLRSLHKELQKEYEEQVVKLRHDLQAREDDLEATVDLTLQTRSELDMLRARCIELLTENRCLKQQLGILQTVTASYTGEIHQLQHELRSAGRSVSRTHQPLLSPYSSTYSCSSNSLCSPVRQRLEDIMAMHQGNSTTHSPTAAGAGTHRTPLSPLQTDNSRKSSPVTPKSPAVVLRNLFGGVPSAASSPLYYSGKSEFNTPACVLASPSAADDVQLSTPYTHAQTCSSPCPDKVASPGSVSACSGSRQVHGRGDNYVENSQVACMTVAPSACSPPGREPADWQGQGAHAASTCCLGTGGAPEFRCKQPTGDENASGNAASTKADRPCAAVRLLGLPLQPHSVLEGG